MRTLFSSCIVRTSSSLLFIFILHLSLVSSLYGQANTPTQQEKELRAQQLMVQAMTQSFLGYHDRAIPIFEEALKETPSSATINSALAESHEHLGDFSSAIFYANQALQLDQDEIHFHRHLIHLHIQSDDIERAETLLTGLLDRFPRDIASLEDLVEIQSLLGKTRAALVTQNQLIEIEGSQRNNLEVKLHILKVLQEWNQYESTLLNLETLSPQNIAYKQELALFFISQNRPEDAIQKLKEALEIAPSDPALTSLLSRQYEKAGNHAEAQALFEAQDETTITDPDVAYQRALRLVTEENDAPSSAKQLLRRVLDGYPDHVEANTLLGTLLYEEGAFKEASPFLKKAVEMNPRAQDTWLMATDAFYKSYDYPQALLMAEESLLLFPGQLPLLELSALAHLKTHNHETALTQFEEYLDILSRNSPLPDTESSVLKATALAYSGLAQGALSQSVASDSLHAAALALHPDNEHVLSTTALSMAEQGKKLDEALKYVLQANTIAPEDPGIMEIVGRVYFKMQNLQESEQWLQKVVQSRMSSPTTFEYLGDLLLEAGKPTEAIASWKKSIELYPDNPIILEKLRTHSN
ncbi:MAG: tetratricopeptide repeat protein [Rhodothermaceae bacterium]|nr:tetratricopeptide repeat protein [Rhodothermaceae bacterium]